MKGYIDRIEGNYYIVELESEEVIQVEKGSVTAKEGDVVQIENGQIVSVLEDETEKRKASVEALMNDLFSE